MDLFAEALMLEPSHKDRFRTGELALARDYTAMDGNQKRWWAICNLMDSRKMPLFDGTLTGPSSNKLHRQARRLSGEWAENPNVDRVVRTAASHMSQVLTELADAHHKVVYVFVSDKYPGLLKIGSATDVKTRVRQQLDTDEAVTVLRTYKGTMDFEVLEDKFHQHYDVLRSPLPGRTECFSVSLADVDLTARCWGLHIHAHEMRISR